MLRKLFTVFIILLSVMLALSACSKKEEVEGEKTGSEAAVPAVVPGEMALIPAGEFVLGSEDKASISYPKQKVNLPAYWIDKYEVTNMEFLDYSLKTGYVGEGAKEGKDWRLFFTPATPEKAKLPVVYISWNDANTYCKSAGKRLPTEEEWEKAARGADGGKYPWGNEWISGRANTSEAGRSKPVPVGEYEDVSVYGVHDMLGNVREWTGSWFVNYKGTLKKDPHSGNQWRVLRGLSYSSKAKLGDLSIRSAYAPEALYDFGFRCAKDATPEDAAKAAKDK
jgi:formylglycine-generating enzyme required for sulfatase activity